MKHMQNSASQRMHVRPWKHLEDSNFIYYLEVRGFELVHFNDPSLLNLCNGWVDKSHGAITPTQTLSE